MGARGRVETPQEGTSSTMYQLLQLAAQHAGVDDIFHTLVPRWALGTLFDRILMSKNADHTPLTTTWFQVRTTTDS